MLLRARHKARWSRRCGCKIISAMNGCKVRRIFLPLAEAIRKFAIADLTNSPRGCAMSHGPLQT
jgi:hypothetical protein